jgi:hypothetical protein
MLMLNGVPQSQLRLSSGYDMMVCKRRQRIALQQLNEWSAKLRLIGSLLHLPAQTNCPCPFSSMQ